MIPYNQKMFGENLNKLGTYWMEKLPNVSFEDTLRSCLMHKAYGQQPGHAKFYYPKKYGYGELWSRMAQKLGDHIEYQKKVSSIDFSSKSVKTVDGSNYRADVIVTTIPWTDFLEITGMPDQLKSSLRKLKHSSIQVQYFGENLDTTAQWVYYPDPELSYHRILVRSNFCQHSKGYWTETNTNRIGLSRDNSNTFINEYAYPLNTIDKPAIMKNVLTWAQEQNVYGLGRWGEHQHYNSDLVVQCQTSFSERS
jgi:protoporphyrinogen oxidase